MNDEPHPGEPPGEPEAPRHYRWPKFVLAAVVLGIILAVIWVRVAVKNVEQERDLDAPLPNSAPAR